MTSLREQLSRSRLGMNAEIRTAYETMVADLARSGLIGNVIAVDQQFPDVALPTAGGDLVRLSDWWREGPLVVTFFRGEWCPYCRLMLAALEEALPEIDALGARLVAVTPETGGRALRVKERHNERYEVLSDVDCGLGLACGVVFQSSPAYRDLLLSRGNDLAERHGNEAWFLPLPATFVLDRVGIVRWRFAEVDFTHRAEPADIIAALRQLALSVG